jgi:hypothetical protein
MAQQVEVPGVGMLEFPDGMQQSDMAKAIQKNFPQIHQAKQDGLSAAVADVPRQLGLTARYGIEGVGNTLDALATPIRAGMNLIPGVNIRPGGGKTIADAIGLPEPRTSTERVVGDVSRLMAGSAVPLGLASKTAEMTTGAPQAVSKALAANPAQQIVSAGASGGAGGAVRENGGNDAAQFAAALAAGVAAPFAMSKATQAGNAAKSAMSRRIAPQKTMEAVDRAIESSGITLGDLAPNVRNSIRNDVQEAMRTDGPLAPDAIRRLADYRTTGATPTAARLTLDPATVTRERNLAKQGINSNDKVAQQLGQVENANNRRLIENLNDLGAAKADDAYAGGQKIIQSLARRDDAAKAAIGARYDAARASNGRAAALDPSAFTQKANDLLDDALLGGKLPGDVRGLLNKTAQGEMPLTVDVAEQLKTRIGGLQRASNDMAERKALGLVRQALDDTPLLDGQGAEAITAFNKARRLNRAYMGIVDKTPALQAVRDGIEPDKFVQQFIVGSGSKANVSDLSALKSVVRNDPQALEAVKGQITAHLKKQALNGAADEVGNVSQAAYNKALANIGDRKLSMFFKPDEVAQLKAVGRVAGYEQFQPRGSAVNNSNTAGALFSSILDRIGGSSILSKIPIANSVSDAARSITTSRGAQQALNVPGALGMPPYLAAPQPRGLLLSPAILMGPRDDERQGLLAAP